MEEKGKGATLIFNDKLKPSWPQGELVKGMNAVIQSIIEERQCPRGRETHKMS